MATCGASSARCRRCKLCRLRRAPDAQTAQVKSFGRLRWSTVRSSRRNEVGFGELSAQVIQGRDVVLMAMSDEDVAKLELVLRDQVVHGPASQPVSKQPPPSRETSSQVAIDGHASCRGSDAAQLAPRAQVAFVSAGNQPLAIASSLPRIHQIGECCQVGFLWCLAGFLEPRQFRLRQAGARAAAAVEPFALPRRLADDVAQISKFMPLNLTGGKGSASAVSEALQQRAGCALACPAVVKFRQRISSGEQPRRPGRR